VRWLEKWKWLRGGVAEGGDEGGAQTGRCDDYDVAIPKESVNLI